MVDEEVVVVVVVVADSTGCNGSASRLTRRTRLDLSTYRKHREREEDKRRPETFFFLLFFNNSSSVFVSLFSPSFPFLPFFRPFFIFTSCISNLSNRVSSLCSFPS